MIEIYDKTEEARYEGVLLRSVRPKFICQRCGKQTGYHQDPESILVLTRNAWDRVVNKFREEQELPQMFNRNVLLCPSCMEELNGGRFKESELGTRKNGKSLPGNEWYVERIDCQ